MCFLSADAQRNFEETKILADDATRDLEKAMPALDAAVDALEKLDKKSIAEAGGFLIHSPSPVKCTLRSLAVLKKDDPRVVHG